MKYIIGISGYFHDSSVCLFANNSMIEFIREETLTRVKGTNHFPYRSLNFLKTKYELDTNNIEFVCFYEKPLRGWFSNISLSFRSPFKRRELLKNQLKQFWNGPTNVSHHIIQILEIGEEKILFAPHHISHVLSAIPYQRINLDETALHFVFDAVGDGICSSIFSGTPTKLEILNQNQHPHSIGFFYSAITEFCGFNINEGEFKLMALAAYGKPIHANFILNNLIKFSTPSIKLNLDWFNFHKSVTSSYSSLFQEKFGTPANQNDLLFNAERFQDFADIAASAQNVAEKIICEIISWGIRETGIQNITVSGGVAQNCVAMYRASLLPEVKSFTVPPSPGDSGAAIGAANFASIIGGKNPIKIDTISFGNFLPEPNTNIFTDLFETVDNSDSYSSVAKLLDYGEIICTFVGGNEIGPRALGHRSILCSGSNREVIQSLNTIIKKRESFRPLAPVMKSSTAQKYFQLNKNSIHNYRWMGLTAFAKQELPDQYSRCLHVDGSARLQIAEEGFGPIFDILQLVKDEILLNTSFNVSGDPMVGDYIDCYVNMQRMGLTYLLTDTGLFKIKDTAT